MSRRSKGLTLLELIITLITLGVVLLMLTSGYLFVLRHFATNLKRANINLQMDYALENIKLHLVSASKVDGGSLFNAGLTKEKDEFRFLGETDIYNITPDNLADNVWCHYFAGELDNKTGLLLSTYSPSTGAETLQEVLVDGRYNPSIKFEYKGADVPADEPNFLRVTIAASSGDVTVTKTEGIGLWFMDIAK